MNFYEVLFALKTNAKGFVNHYETLFANALNGGTPTPTLSSITAVFNQGTATVYDTDTLDSLKQYLTVTATYSDSTTETVTTYTLSGTLTVGTSTITAAYQGKSDTFNVTVSQKTAISWEYIPTRDGLLSNQNYVTATRDGTNADKINESLEYDYYRLTCNSVSGWPAMIFAFNTATILSHAEIEAELAIVNMGYGVSTNATSPGFSNFQLSDGTKTANVGFMRYNANNATPKIRYYTGSGSTATWGADVSLGVWHKIKLVVDSGKQSIYLDDVAVVSNIDMGVVASTNRYMFSVTNTQATDIRIKSIAFTTY